MLVLSTRYLLAIFYKQCSVWRQPSWYQTEETPTLKQPQNRVLVFSLCFALSGLCLLPVAQRTAAASCADDVTLDSQVAINNFASDYAGCTSLGSLRVQEAVDGDIQSLEGLSQLTSVDGALQIFNNARLLTVDGLEKITSVGAHEFQLDDGSVDNATNFIVNGGLCPEPVSAIQQLPSGMWKQVTHTFEYTPRLRIDNSVFQVLVIIFEIKYFRLSRLMLHVAHDSNLFAVPHDPWKALIGGEDHILTAFYTVNAHDILQHAFLFKGQIEVP